MKVITVGRAVNNDIVINDPKVSRIHLQIVQNDNGICSVVDLNSANGTYVNNEKISGEKFLEENDTIRIGDTSLPWQSYVNNFNPDIHIAQSASDKTPDKASSAHKNKRIIYMVVPAVTIFVLLAFILGYKLYINRQSQNDAAILLIEQQRQDSLRHEQELRDAKMDKLQEETDKAFRDALISQSDRSKRLAETKQKEAIEANKKAEQALQAKAESDAERHAAIEEKNAAIQAKSEAEEKSKQVIQEIKDEATIEVSMANAARDEANRKAELTEKFYIEYSELTDKKAKEILELLENGSLNQDSGYKQRLKEKFQNAQDNDERQKIVDTIINMTQSGRSSSVSDSVDNGNVNMIKDQDNPVLDE